MVAQRYFANENPIGRRFLPVSWKDPITIVGIVGDTRQFGLDARHEESAFQRECKRSGDLRWRRFAAGRRGAYCQLHTGAARHEG